MTVVSLCGALSDERSGLSLLPEVEVKLRPAISRPVCLAVGVPSGAHDKIFVSCLTTAGFLLCGALSDERITL
jgi:hypothetical protein